MVISSNKLNFFREFVINQINILQGKIKKDLLIDLRLKRNPVINVEKYNFIYVINSEFELENSNYLMDTSMKIIFVTHKEYYITQLNLKQVKKKKLSSKFRESQFYNKWII